jgi:hypothetical protein
VCIDNPTCSICASLFKLDENLGILAIPDSGYKGSIAFLVLSIEACDGAEKT